MARAQARLQSQSLLKFANQWELGLFSLIITWYHIFFTFLLCICLKFISSLLIASLAYPITNTCFLYTYPLCREHCNFNRFWLTCIYKHAGILIFPTEYWYWKLPCQCSLYHCGEGQTSKRLSPNALHFFGWACLVQHLILNVKKAYSILPIFN